MKSQSVNLFYNCKYNKHQGDVLGFHLLLRGLMNPVIPKVGDFVKNLNKGVSIKEINEGLKPLGLFVLENGRIALHYKLGVEND